MPSLFLGIKFVHVLLAIIAVGFNATYGVWLATVATQPTPTQSFVLRGIKRLDDWFANPAYVLLAVTGLTMAFVGELPLNRFWLAGGLQINYSSKLNVFAQYLMTSSASNFLLLSNTHSLQGGVRVSLGTSKEGITERH